MDPKEVEAMDAPLVALASRSGGDLGKLLTAFFSFLHRRTDFYLIPHPDDDDCGGTGTGTRCKMGFREGQAEKLLLAAFRQFPLRRIPRGGYDASAAAAAAKDKPKKTNISSSHRNGKTGSNDNEKNQTSLPSSQNQKEASKNEKKEGTKSDEEVASGDPVGGGGKGQCRREKSMDKKNNMEGVRYTEEGLQVPVGNGGCTSRYKWTQTLDECSVLIGLPNGTRGKDLDVTIRPTHVSVRSKKSLAARDAPAAAAAASAVKDPGTTAAAASCADDADADPFVFVDGPLHAHVIPSESTWTLEGGVLIVVLYKRVKTFWKTIIAGDDEIDTSQVDSRRHVSDYDESTQAQIRRIVHEQSCRARSQQDGSQSSSSSGAAAAAASATAAERLSAKLGIPPAELPQGVEYIDQKTLDDAAVAASAAAASPTAAGVVESKEKK